METLEIDILVLSMLHEDGSILVSSEVLSVTSGQGLMQIDEVIWRICHHYEASIEEVDSSGKLLGSDHYLDRYGILVRNVSNSLLFYELLEQGECMNGNFVLWRSVSDLELANRICFQCISFEFFCQLIAHCLDVLLGLDENQHIP